MRSDWFVLRWLKTRAVVHLAIAILFVLPMVALLRIVPTLEHPYASKVRLWFDGLEYATDDYRIQFGRKAQADPQIVLLAIDATSISLESLDAGIVAQSDSLSLMKKTGFPFPRDVYADACERLFGAGAKVVAFDIFFRSVTPADERFEQALEKYRNQTVVGMNFSDEAKSTTVYCNLPSESLVPSRDPFDDLLGYLNFWKDSTETTVRSAQYRNNLNYANRVVGADQLPKLYSLASRVVQKFGHPDLVPNDLEERPLRFAGPSRFATFPFYTLFYPADWANTFHNGEYFRGKIVIIGPVGDWSKDSFLTPTGELPGVEVHLNAINSLLHHEFLIPCSEAFFFSTVVGAGLIALLLAMTIIPIAWRFLAALGVAGGYVFALIWAFNGPGWLLPAVAPMSVFCGATGVGFIYDFVLTQIEKLRLRSTLEGYNSPKVVQYLLEHTEAYKEMLAGARRPVTLLFSDVRGFTTLAERGDTHAIVTKLNEYLTAMVACVFRFDGNLDCFMGDGIMAAWGNLPFNHDPKADAVNAVRSALAMLAELRRLNAKWIDSGDPPWQVGIGLNHGEVIVGDIGSQQHKEYATIGDAVNLASRIESLTKEYHVEILVGENVANLVHDQFHLKTADLVQAKGKNVAVEIFTVLGEKTTPLDPDAAKFLTLYEQGIVHMRKREFEAAQNLFERALQIQPEDFLAEYHRKACLDYLETPPDASWTGVRVMTKK